MLSKFHAPQYHITRRDSAWLKIITTLTVLSLMLSMLGIKSVSAIQSGQEDATITLAIPDPSTTVISLDAPDPSMVGEVVTVTVTVIGGGPTPTGTVDITGADTNCSITLGNGTGSCDIVFNSTGAKSIVATYSGDSYYNSSIDTEDHQVNRTTPTFVITTMPDPSLVGEVVTVTVTVIGGGPTPTGTVDIAGADTNCSITLGNGTGSCGVVFNSVGAKTITATYSGDSYYDSGTDTEAHQVYGNPTTAAVIVDMPDPSLTGEAVEVTVTVTGEGTSPTGTVDITGADMNCSITLVDGAGSCEVSFNSIGAKTIVATYSGDGYYDSSADTEAHEVIGTPATAIITADAPDPSLTGEAVTITVTVTGAGPVPTGTVDITGADMNCSITLVSGTGNCDVAFNSMGAKTIVAAYSGDGYYISSTDTETHQVNLSAPAVAITADAPDPSTPGEAVTVTVNVTGYGPVPIGTVSITGADTNCSITLVNGTGSCEVVFTSVGAKTIAAAYSGDVYYDGNTDTEAHQVNFFNDPLFGMQWGLAKININGAWDDTYGSSTVIIAVIDSGIDLSPHPDLQANLWVNPGEIPDNGIDDDSNGFIDDINGWNFVADNNNVWDDNGHGTLIAGIVAAESGNGQGIVGVCPQCRIMPVKVMQASGVVNYSDIAEGVLYAAQKGAKVINLSVGGYSNSVMLRNAINTAVNTYGVVVVAGSGNDNSSTPFYPAAYENVLAVAGTVEDDTKASNSNYGTWVDVSAPAINVRTTALGGGWANGSGTSVASGFVTGLAGLLRALHPDWSEATIRSQIMHTTDNIDAANPSFVGLLGTGRLNAGAAMGTPQPILRFTSYAVNGQTNGRPVLGTTVNLTITLNNDWWDATGVTGTLSTTDTYVTIVNNVASFGDIPAVTSKANTPDFIFTVASGSGYNHPIPFTLDITDINGYSNSYSFTVNTETGVITKSGTLTTQTWTNDKTYLITGNISIPTLNTLTIQPGTVIKFDGSYTLSVRGTLIADGTSDQPIQFKSNSTGIWGSIFFDDLNIDAVVDAQGNYIAGSILRYINMEGSTGGITCTAATPYLSHLNLQSGGITCTLGATPAWFLDNTVTGDVSFTGTGNAYRNTVSGGLSVSGAGIAQDNILGGTLSLGSGMAEGNTTGGGLTVGGTAGRIENNLVKGGNVSAGVSFSVLNNTFLGSLTTGNSATVDHNTISGGIMVGSDSTVTWNSVENASGIGLSAGANVTARYNRLIGNATGMIATTGLIEHNLIVNNTGIGLQVGAATIRYNSFTGNWGNTILVQGGTPVTIEFNNLESNTGTYDLYLNIPSSESVPAQNNWWGTTDDITIAQRVYDWNDDDLKATASYNLKATAPDQTAPAYVRGVTILPDTTLGIQEATFEVQFSKPMDPNYSPTVAFHDADKNSWQFFNTTNSGIPSNTTCGPMLIDSRGDLWIGGSRWWPDGTGTINAYCTGNGLSIYRKNGTWSVIGESPNALVEDIDGNIRYWDSYISSAVLDKETGDIWTGIYGSFWDGGGVRQLHPDGSITKFTTSNSGLAHGSVIALAMDRSTGDLWIATWSGVSVRHRSGEWESFLQGVHFASIGIDHSGNVYAGCYESCGVWVRHQDGTWENLQSNPIYGLASGQVWSIYTDASGNVWFIDGRYGQGISVLHPDGLWEQVPKPSVTVWSVAVDTEGNTWFGTEISGLVARWGGAEHQAQGIQWVSPTVYRATYDINALVAKGNYRVLIRDAVDENGMVMGPNSVATFTVEYAGSITDKTPPLEPIVTASGNGSLTTISASWNSAEPESTIVQYRYAIGTSPGARDVVAWTYTNGTLVTRSNLNLTPGGTYYVLASARNEGGLWSDSGVSNGVIAGAPPGNFGKNAPVNNATNLAFNMILNWRESDGALTYEYCYYAGDNNTCDHGTWTEVIGTSVELLNLDPNTTYHWQVRARNLGVVVTNADDDTWWSFTTHPNSYTISGNVGVGGATLNYTDGTPKTAVADENGNYSFSVSYDWSGTVTLSKEGYIFLPASRTYTNVLANQMAQNYTANIIMFTIFGNAGVGSATLSYVDGTARTATANSHGEYSFTIPYDWSGTVTPSKTGYTFLPVNKTYTNVTADQTAQNYMATLALLAPANGEVLSYRRPTFDWLDIPDASGYQVVASKTTSFTAPLWKVNTISSNYTPTADLPGGKVIYWRVRAKVSGVWGAWSGTGSFTTPKSPSIPVLVSPANKALIKNYTPLLDWSNSTVPSGSAGFSHYEVQIDTDQLFTAPVLIDNLTATTSSFTPGTDLTANTKYFWRVRSYNMAGQYSSWSTVWSFRTVLLSPSNLTPQGGEIVSSRKPALSWDAVEGASGYALQISTSNSFTTLIVSTTVAANTFIPSTRLPANSTIYWRVRAMGTNGPSRWTTASFHTP